MIKNWLLVATLGICSAAFCEPPNLSSFKESLRHYYDSGSYQKELTQSIEKARKYIAQRNSNNPTHQKLAVVLDIDETSLSNYENIIKQDFAFNAVASHQHILAADDPAIKPTLDLYKQAKQQGVAIFFITGRKFNEMAATEKNLLAAGFKNWDGLYGKPKNYHLSSNIPFKTQMRHRIMDKGYVIIASIGDQQSDLTGGYAEKTFKLPNPFYYLP